MTQPFNQISTLQLNERYESFVVLEYTDRNLSKSANVLIVTWMVRLSVSSNDGVFVISDEQS